MKKILLTLALMLATPAFAQTQEETTDMINPIYKEFTENLANEAMGIIMSSEANDAKVNSFTKLFMENCDLRYVGRFVLGQYWKGLEDSEREAFLQSFTDSVIMSWASRFNTFQGGKLEINSVNKSENPNSKDHFVNSTMTFTNGTKPAEVVWRERLDKEGKVKVIDIVIEGISMAMTYRNEYRSVLQRNDGNVSDLITSLNENTQNLKANFK